MHSPIVGEFAGTLVLILLGDGVVANVVLKHSKAEGAGWMVITTAWGFAVFCGILTAIAFGSADAHLNPAVTLAFAITSGNYAKIVPYWSAQVLGAFTGATLVWLYFLPHWKLTEEPEAKRAVFCTTPAIRHYRGNLFCEVIGTMLLLIVIAAIGSKAVAPGGLAPGISSYFVAILVWAIGLSLGGTTGYAINPARDFGPRVAHALWPIAGKGNSDWSYAPIPIVGPLLGAVLAAVVIKAAGLA
jgi:glycerol uptake facilitator protein